jgi:Myb-like DNA-binding domain
MKWSESILEIPTLVQLGYGGVPSPIVDKDEDDISSWGGDSDLGEETERANSSQHSYSRIVNAALRGRDSALTDAEKESIARIASNRSRRTPYSRSNSGDCEQVGIVAAKPHRKGKRHSKRSQPSIRPVEASGVGDDWLPVDHSGQEQGQPRNDVAPSSPRQPRDPCGELPLHLARKITASEPIEIDCRSDDELNALTSSVQGITGRDTVDEASDTDLKPIKLSREEMTTRPKKRLRADKETAPKPAISSKARPSAPWLDDVACDGGEQEMEDSDDEAFSAVARKPKNKDPSRRRFTREEMDAVRDGVEKYGVGQWKDIQKNDPRLRHRNSTQVKDKYRTMVNRGEID